MPSPPAGATMSPDGNYWWDETADQWQLVDPSAAASSSAATSSSPTATASEPAGYDAAASSSGGDPSAGGGTGVAEQLAVEGICESGELSGDEIQQILSAAGAELTDA